MFNSKPPICSIVMSTRNKAAMLQLTLASIFRQQVPFAFEVIVVDDGSTDNTWDVCKQHDLRYLRLENPRHRNPSVARNVGYRAATGPVIIAQSDDVIHVSPNMVTHLTTSLKSGEFLIAKVENWEYKNGKPRRFLMEYCGMKRQKPYFFLGSLFREDLYAIGGCDEEFVEPGYDDDWFADCLIRGRRLKPRYTEVAYGHHQEHGSDKGSHAKEHISKALYQSKIAKGLFISSGGAWPYEGY